MREKDNLKGGKKVLLDKSYLVIQVSDNSQEDVSRFISEVEYAIQCSENVNQSGAFQLRDSHYVETSSTTP